MAHLVDLDNVVPADSLYSMSVKLTTWRTRIDALNDVLGDITAAEANQVENMGDETISLAQWGYLGGCTVAGGALLDDANAAAQRTTLGLGSIATQAASSVAITGGSITGITTLTAGGALDIGAYGFRAASLTADGLTATRVVFAGANGLLSDAAAMTFVTDTLTVTKIGAFQATGAINFDSQNMTNVDIDSGTIGGVTLDGAIAGGDQAFTGVGDMTFTAGSLLRSGVTGADTLLLAANDTTFITLTTGAPDTLGIGAFTLSGKLTGGASEIEGSAFDINGGTIASVTLDGAIAGGDQAFTNVGDMTFATASLLKSGDTNTNTLLIAANDTTFITLTTAAPDTCAISGAAIDNCIIGAGTAVALTCTTFTSTGIDDNADANAITISVDEVVSLGIAKLTVGATTPTAAQWGYLGAATQGIWKTTTKARAYLSANQEDIVSGEHTKVLLDTESYDPGSNFDTTDNKFTAPVSGYYLVSATVRYLDGTLVADKRWGAIIKLNGETWLTEYYIHSSLADTLTIILSDIIHLDATDYIELWTLHLAGVNTPDLAGGASHQTSLAIHLVSED